MLHIHFLTYNNTENIIEKLLIWVTKNTKYAEKSRPKPESKPSNIIKKHAKCQKTHYPNLNPIITV